MDRYRNSQGRMGNAMAGKELDQEQYRGMTRSRKIEMSQDLSLKWNMSCEINIAQTPGAAAVMKEIITKWVIKITKMLLTL